MAFSIFMMLCDHHLCLVPKVSSPQKKILYPLSSQYPFPSPLAPSNHQFVFCPYRFTYSRYFIYVESYNV